MKKVLIGVGVGCGLLIILVIGAVVAGGFMVKKKFDGTLEATQKMATQGKELAELDQRSGFKAPPDGEVLALDAKRLEAYFAVRQAALPAFKAMEAKGEAFAKEHGGEEGKEKAPDFNAAVEATNLMMSMTAEVRAAYLEGLKQQGMSPSEFQAITGTVYTSLMTEGLEQAQAAMRQGREAMEKQLAELDKKLEGDALSEQERTMLEEARGNLQDSIESMQKGSEDTGLGHLSEAGRKTAAANVVLLKQYEQQVQAMASAAFDSFLLGGYDSSSVQAGEGAQEDND